VVKIITFMVFRGVGEGEQMTDENDGSDVMWPPAMLKGFQQASEQAQQAQQAQQQASRQSSNSRSSSSSCSERVPRASGYRSWVR